MSKRGRSWSLGLGAVVLLLAAALAANALWFRPWSLHVFYERVFLQSWTQARERLASPAEKTAHFLRLRRDLEQLRAYPISRQTPSQRLSTAVLDWSLARSVESEKWQWHDFPVNQIDGMQSLLPTELSQAHPLRGVRDCEAYLNELAAWPEKFDQLIAGLKVREAKGIIPPRIVIDRSLLEMWAFAKTPAAENIIATSFHERVQRIAKLTPEQRSDYQQQVEGMIRRKVYPAYARLLEYMVELHKKTTDDAGAWTLPEGEAFYAFQLRRHTTLALGAAEIHALGLQEVARIEAELRPLLDAQGFAGQPVGVALTALATDPRFLYPNDDAGRAAVLAEGRRLAGTARELSQPLFTTLPEAALEIRRTPVFKEKTVAAASYLAPASDGARPGFLYINLRDLNERPRWSLPPLVYREGLPGHHLQVGRAQALRGLPRFRKSVEFTAYTEGWAAYAAGLVRTNDPLGEVGRLQAELLNAMRLVVDTGLNAQRWTQQQAVDYLRATGGIYATEAIAEVESCIAVPGRACGRHIGALKIRALRARAERALGVKFDLREFHDVLLREGALPLEILEQQVTGYLAQRQAQTGNGAN